MYLRLTLLFLSLIAYTVGRSQETMNFPGVEKKSYQLYQEKKWDDLIKFSSQARKQGIDFFYLQVRTGLAYYNEGKYGKAADYLLKAYSNDQSFEWLQEYLYYSLVYSGRFPEALKYASLFSDDVKSKIGFRDRGVYRLAYEAGYGFNPLFEELTSRAFGSEVNLGDDYGEGTFLKDYSFHSLDVGHKIAPDVMLNHSFTYIGVNRQAVVDWGVKSSSPLRINQFQYFLNPVWVIGKKLNISPSVTLIFGSGDVLSGGLTADSSKVFNLSKFSYSDVLFSTAIWSNFRNLSPGAEINFGNINNTKLTQLSLWLTMYPLSNTRLFVTPRVYFKTGSDFSGAQLKAVGISGGARIGKAYLSGQYLTGEMENFIESAGYVVYNFPGKSERKISGSLNFPLSKKCQFVFRYINQNIQEKYQVYTDGYKSNYLEYNYIKHTITTGLSWNF